MIGDIPIVSFDTSTYNELVKDRPRAEIVLAGLKSGLSFRFVGLSIDEMVATADPIKRAALFAYCSRIQDGLSECIYPHNELTTRMVEEHHKNPATFDWKKVDVKAREYERAIRRRELVDDEKLSADQRADLKARKKEYEDMWAGLRPQLDAVFEKYGECAPPRFREVIARLQSGSTLIWYMGKLLYDRSARIDASEATVREFIDACPPFRAIIYAMLLSWYDRTVSPEDGEKFEAGRNDLFMAVHLPYCDKFVTAEKYREQERCLREVAFVAGLETEVISYDDFCDSFLVTVNAGRFHYRPRLNVAEVLERRW
jgi:hypothetical protein